MYVCMYVCMYVGMLYVSMSVMHVMYVICVMYR